MRIYLPRKTVVLGILPLTSLWLRLGFWFWSILYHFQIHIDFCYTPFLSCDFTSKSFDLIKFPVASPFLRLNIKVTQPCLSMSSFAQIWHTNISNPSTWPREYWYVHYQWRSGGDVYNFKTRMPFSTQEYFSEKYSQYTGCAHMTRFHKMEIFPGKNCCETADRLDNCCFLSAA